MGKLYLIGVGLSPDLITLRGIKAARSVSKLYLDVYTSAAPVNIVEELMKLIGRRIEPIGRGRLEDRSDELIGELEVGDVGILVVGDPLIATTHISLIIEASRKGYGFEVIPAPGIIPNAITLSGLMIYKMGKVATITFPKNNILSEYPYDVIKDNDARNLHTPLLLEFDAEKGIEMRINEAVEILLKIEERRREGVINTSRKAVAISALGTTMQRICCLKIGDLINYSYSIGPHTLIILSPKLHFIEEEALKVITGEFCRQ